MRTRSGTGASAMGNSVPATEDLSADITQTWGRCHWRLGADCRAPASIRRSTPRVSSSRLAMGLHKKRRTTPWFLAIFAAFVVWTTGLLFVRLKPYWVARYRGHDADL